MPRKAESIKLSNDELSSLKTLLRRGAAPARTQTRARVLDLLHRGRHPNSVAETLRVSGAAVFNIKRRYLEAGLDAALFDQPRPGRPPTIDGKMRAQITALACSRAPEGHAGWRLRLLADKAVELGFVASISHTGIRKLLKKTASSRTSTSSGA
jgi:putative transposase